MDNTAQAIERGLGFLLAAQTPGGSWQDFHLAAGIGEEWITGYVGTMLAELPKGRAAAEAGWNWLCSQAHRDSGWGFNHRPPPDADSTAWALHLAQALNIPPSERLQKARTFLSEHLINGSITTYADERPIGNFIRAPWYASLRGWSGTSHVCVTAATAALDDFRPQLLEFLRQSQTDSGCWIGYWWVDASYATALSAAALSLTGQDEPLIELAIAWGRERAQAEGSPFVAGWLIRLLALRDGHSDVIEQLTQYLTESQQPDGSWESSAWMRIPLPDDIVPENYENWLVNGRKEGSLAQDHLRVFTTATVVRALYKR